LKSLIISILKSNIDKSLIENVNIIVVDNDIDRSAEEIENELSGSIKGIYKLNYYNYPLKGLSNVRNELIAKALILNPDFLIFIDDDEYVTVDWMIELLRVILRNNGDMAIGPVVSVFDNKISKYISWWFRRPDYADNTKIKYIRTGNLIIKTHSLLKYETRFDKRFNRTGSEDTYFGVQMIKKGATVFWAANAVAYETVPASRINLKWLIKRKYRAATTVIFIRKLEKDYLGIFRKTLGSFFYIVSGIFALIMLMFPVTKKYWGLIKISEGIGGLAGLFNLKYYEYS
jgi:hypothetical protein